MTEADGDLDGPKPTTPPARALGQTNKTTPPSPRRTVATRRHGRRGGGQRSERAHHTHWPARREPSRATESDGAHAAARARDRGWAKLKSGFVPVRRRPLGSSSPSPRTQGTRGRPGEGPTDHPRPPRHRHRLARARALPRRPGRPG